MFLKAILSEMRFADFYENITEEGFPTFVRLWMKVKTLGGSSRVSKAEENLIVLMRKKGYSMNVMSYMFHRSTSTIQKILEKHGLSGRT